MPITIRDVARAAGVSQATAARALGGYGYVSAAARRRVEAASVSLGYQPNAVARALVSGSTRTIGLVVADIENPFFATAARALADVVEREGYTLLLANSDEDLERERDAVAAFRARRVDGLAVVPCSTGDGVHLEAVLRDGTPLVLLDRPVRGLAVDTVMVDNAAGAAAGVRHLIAHGHRRIGLVSDTPEIASSAERIQGYRRALREAGIEPDPALVSLGGSTQPEAHAAARVLLDRQARPTAIFTVNNFMTIGVLLALRDARLQIPGDVALVGFDDLDWTTLVEPPLTVVAQPVTDLGRAVGHRLLARIGGDTTPPRRLRLRSELIVRRSCGGDHR